MSTHAKTIAAHEVAAAVREGARPSTQAEDRPGRGASASSSRARDEWQLRVLVGLGAAVLLVPATIAWLTRWRWQPWPPGRDGYGSAFHEAHVTAAAYVPMGFGGY